MERYLNPRHPLPTLRFLAMDTEFVTVPEAERVTCRELVRRGADDPVHPVRITGGEQFSIGVEKTNLCNALRNPEQFGAEDFVRPEYLKEVIKGVKGDGAGGFGIVGKMALWNRLDSWKQRLQDELTALNNIDQLQRNLRQYDGRFELSSEHQINIIVLCSLGGGTGKGTALTTGVLLRELLRKIDVDTSDRAQIMLFNYCPTSFKLAGRKVSEDYFKTIQRNQAAAMIELEAALKHGYAPERKLREVLGLDEQHVSQDIFTDVLQISAQLDRSGAYVGDYRTLNEAVAETVTDFVFGNMIGDLRAYFRSNKGAFVTNNPLRESHGLPVRRSRDFGRIGRHKLLFPQDRLFRYARHYHIGEQLRSIIGGVEPVERAALQQEVRRMVTDLVERARHLVPSYEMQTLSQIGQPFVGFDDPWILAIREAARGVENNLRSQFQTTGQRKARIYSELDTILDDVFGAPGGLNDLLKTYVRTHGLLGARELLANLNAEIQAHLRTEYAEEFFELQSTKGEEETNDLLMGRLRKQMDRRSTEFQPFSDGTAREYTLAKNALQEDRSAWERKNSRWWVKIRGQEARSLRESRQPLENLTTNARNAFFRYRDAAGRFAHLLLLFSFRMQIAERIDLLTANRECIEPTTGGEGILHRHEASTHEIIRERGFGLATSIIGSGTSDFDTFAQKLETAEGNRFDRLLRERILPLIDRLAVSAVPEEQLNQRISEAVDSIDQLRPQYTLHRHLENMVRTGGEERARELIRTTLEHADFLGKLDAGSTRNGLDGAGFGTTLIRVSDPNWLRRHFADLVGDAQITKLDNPNELTVTRLETGLPLFVFREFQEAQRAYTKHLDKDSMAVHTFHTHDHFTELSYPMGTPTELDDAQGRLFFHLLLHTNLIQTRDHAIFQQRYPRRMDDNWIPFEDKRLDPFTYTDSERSVSPERWLRGMQHRRSWFDWFVGLFRRYLEAYVQRETHGLRRYLTDGTFDYPCFPPTILQVLIDTAQSPVLKRELRDFRSANLKRYERMREEDRLRSDAPLIRTRAELTDFYELPVEPKLTKKGKKLRYRVATTKRNYPKRMDVNQVVQIIKQDTNVLVSKAKTPSGKDWHDWRNFPEIVAAVKQLPKKYR